MDALNELKTVFSNVNDWLKFAEAKNAALVGFNGASVFGSMSLLYGENVAKEHMVPYLIGFCFLNMVALAVGLWSFLPKGGKALWSRNTARSTNNLVYYGHIYTLKPEEYLPQVRNALYSQCNGGTTLEHMYAAQVVVNAAIAIRKYRYFTIALLITLMGIAILVVGLTLQFSRTVVPVFKKI